MYACQYEQAVSGYAHRAGHRGGHTTSDRVDDPAGTSNRRDGFLRRYEFLAIGDINRDKYRYYRVLSVHRQVDAHEVRVQKYKHERDYGETAVCAYSRLRAFLYLHK